MPCGKSKLRALPKIKVQPTHLALDAAMIDAPFPNRRRAGELLALELKKFRSERPVIYTLPRGGVPVGAPIATALEAPLDLLLVRKIGAPGHEELAAASVVDGETPDIVLNEDVVRAFGMTPADIDAAAQLQLKEIERRRALYLKDRRPVPVEGCTAIVVDDGIATGTTVKAALQALRRRGPKRLVLAVPVAPHDMIAELRPLVDEIVCLQQPEPFHAIGAFYGDFHQVSDEEVTEMLASACGPVAPGN